MIVAVQRAVALLTVLSLNAAQVQFREHTIATGFKGGYQVIAVDVNHDGKPDLIALASGESELVWYENPTWERHVIAGGFKGMINVGAYDVDGDGIPELVLAHGFSMNARNSPGYVSLLEHDGDPRRPWHVREIDRLPASHRIRWADIDGSGHKVAINVALTAANPGENYMGSTPIVYYRPGDWFRTLITDQLQGVVHGIFVTDWDGTGREGFLSASFEGVDLWRRTNEGPWERTRIARGDPSPCPKCGSSDVAIGRSGRGKSEHRFIAAIEPWHGNQVVIYHEQKTGGWTRTVVDPSIVDGHTILTGDFEGDGRDEVVVGFRGGAHSVYLYSAADRASLQWHRMSVDEGGMAAASCTSADFNGDGRLDLACIGSATANLKWYENLGR